MIRIVTGTPGGGKTFYACREIVNALQSGRCVVTNVDVRSDLGAYIADHNVFSRAIPGRRQNLAERYDRSWFYSPNLSDLFAVRLAGKGEGRGLMVLDESHGWMNARDWSADGREEIVAYFTQHRKLGFDVVLITQDIKNIDRQVRSLCEYEVTLKNLRRFKIAGIPMFPVNFFIAVWRWSGIAGTIAKRETFALSWIKDIYDTNQIIFGLDHETPDGGVVLPRPRSAQPHGAEEELPIPDAILNNAHVAADGSWLPDADPSLVANGADPSDPASGQ